MKHEMTLAEIRQAGIELLTSQHNRTDFDCGNTKLNAYLKQIARQHNDEGLSRTFVLIEDKQPNFILGFFTLSNNLLLLFLPLESLKQIFEHNLTLE